MKHKNLKRIIAVLCSIAVTFSSLGIYNSFSVKAKDVASQDATETVTYVQKEVLAENDYSTAGTWTPAQSGGGSRNVTPSTDPKDDSNKVLKYEKSNYTQGAVFFGNDYNTTAVTTDAIKVKAGATYYIQYDYYIEGTEIIVDFELYLVTGYMKSENGSLVVTRDTNNSMELVKYQKGALPTMSDWETKTVSITIPDSYDTTAYPYLMLFGKGGDGENGTVRIKAYFDNVKVITASKVTETVIGENDYSTAGTWTQSQSGNGSRNVTPSTDPKNNSNKVLKYEKSDYGQGAVFFGNDYSTTAVTTDAIKVKAGATYQVQYDYYIEGTAITAQFALYLATGNFKSVNGKNEVTRDTNKSIELVRYQIGQLPKMSDWETKTVSITIPDDYDTTANPYLMLFGAGGDGENGTVRMKAYFDNVKVSEVSMKPVSPIKDVELVSTDYSTAKKDLDTVNSSGDIMPSVDPLDENNMALYLKKDRTSNHQIIIGADYSTDNGVNNCTTTITPVAGASYEIQFDWYGVNNPGSNDIIIYGAVGPITRGDFGNDSANASCYDYQQELFRIPATEQLPDTWSTVKATITIPENITITEGNILLLYVRADVTNKTGHTYFDNIKVTRLAPISAELNVDGQSSSEIYTMGRVPADKYPVVENQAMMWYSDETRNQPFSINDYDSEYPEHIVLYGNYEVADKAFVVGDMNGDSLATSNDLSSMRQHLLGVTADGMEDRADTTRDGSSDLRDLIRLKVMEKGGKKVNFKVNGSETYQVVVPSNDANYSTKNEKLVQDYIGSAVADSTAAADYEIIIGNANRDGVRTISSETGYSIIVDGNKVYVNGGSDKALGAAILALYGCITEGRNLTDGYALDFEYISPEHPADTVGIIPENIYKDDFVTTKSYTAEEAGAIANPAKTLSFAENSISVEAKNKGTEFATQINANKIADFEKSGDKMVHVSTFAIIDGMIYTTYYANATTTDENPIYQDARFVYAPLNDPLDKTYIDLQKHGDICFGKEVVAVYDTIFMQYDQDTLYLMWTAKLDDNYYRLYRKYTISTDTLGPIGINRFKVGNITNDFSITGMKSALIENEISYKDMYADIGIMQKPTTRVENGETYYYTGAYCGDFNCIIKSKDMITWEYVSKPSFVNQSKWENATYVIGDKCYYYVRQNGSDYGFLTCYDLVNGTWAAPVLIEDVQSRSDFIVYNSELYLFYAPKNQDGKDERQHIGIIKVDQENLANSEIIVHAYMGNSCFYPFVQYSDKDELYMSYTIWRKHIRLAKFYLGEILN